jgi:hypothetical protein
LLSAKKIEKINIKDAVHKMDDASHEKNNRSLKVSMYQNCKSIEPFEVELLVVFRAICNGKYLSIVEKVRQLAKAGSLDGANGLQEDLLPAFSLSGQFSGGRTLDHLVYYNKIIGLFINQLPETDYEYTFDKIKNISFTYMAFKSTNGFGIDVFVLVDSSKEFHNEAFKQVKQFYEENLKLKIDITTDIARLSIVSEDNKAY